MLMSTTQTIFLGSVVFVAAAGMVLSQDKSPQNTRTKLTNSHEVQAAAPAGSVKAAADFPVIGYLEKRDRTITIKAGPKGPLYSVRTADGKALCENVSGDQLRAQAPELAEFLKTGVAGPGGPKVAARVSIRAD